MTDHSVIDPVRLRCSRALGAADPDVAQAGQLFDRLRTAAKVDGVHVHLRVGQSRPRGAEVLSVGEQEGVGVAGDCVLDGLLDELPGIAAAGWLAILQGHGGQPRWPRSLRSGRQTSPPNLSFVSVAHVVLAVVGGGSGLPRSDAIYEGSSGSACNPSRTRSDLARAS